MKVNLGRYRMRNLDRTRELERLSVFLAFSNYPKLGGGFKYLLFSPLFGEDFQFDEHIFQMGWFNHQPVNVVALIMSNSYLLAIST